MTRTAVWVLGADGKWRNKSGDIRCPHGRRRDRCRECGGDSKVAQNGLCAITGRGGALHWDHCARSKKFRAFLYRDTNTALGLLRERPLDLINAVNYLIKHALKNGVDPRGYFMTKAGEHLAMYDWPAVKAAVKLLNVQIRKAEKASVPDL